MMNARRLLAELKRRNVLRAGALYIAAVWALAQGISELGPDFGAPGWITRWFVIACSVGFPFWIALAWFYELTPLGLKRESEIAPGESIAAHTGRKLDFAIIGILAVAVVLLVTNQLVWHKDSGADAGAVIPAKSIAVLPFENLSADKANEYFVAGMQDLILSKLAGIGEMKVTSRSSTVKYASRPEDLRTVGRELGVATVLEGSVQKAGNEVLVTVQLIDTHSDRHLWAQTYRRTLDDVFGVEGEVAEKIAAALHARLSPGEAKRLTAGLSGDPEANDLYLRAEYFANRGVINYDVASWKAAIPVYQQAIRRDPKFALARARLATVEGTLAQFGGGGENVQQLRADARAQAARALALAPDLSATHAALGWVEYLEKKDYPAALKAFAAALKLNPNDADVLAARAIVLRRQQRFDAAIDSLQRALARDPRNSGFAGTLALTYMMASRYPEAERMCRRALALDPTNLRARRLYASAIMYGSGDPARALSVAGKGPTFQFQRVALLTWQRRFDAALAALDAIPDTPANFPHDNPKVLQQARIYLQAGNQDQALALYRQAQPGVRAAAARMQSPDNDDVTIGWGYLTAAELDLGLGRTAPALTAIGKAQARFNPYRHDTLAMGYMPTVAQLYAEAGRADLAVPVLAEALSTPGMGASYSPVMLWLDPYWDTIHDDPRFQALLKKYAAYKPAIAGAHPALASTVAGGV